MKKSTLAIGLGVLGIIIILFAGISLFSAQWNLNGYSKGINIEVNGKQELKKVASDGDMEVYTYNLGDCYVTRFIDGKSSKLQDVMFKKISLKDLTSALKENKEEDFDVYEAENYKIYVAANKAIITSNDEAGGMFKETY